MKVYLAGQNGKSKIIRKVHIEGFFSKPTYPAEIQRRHGNDYLAHESIRGVSKQGK